MYELVGVGGILRSLEWLKCEVDRGWWESVGEFSRSWIKEVLCVSLGGSNFVL